MQFLRAEFQINTPIVHNTQFISGHYFHRYFNHSTNALGVIVDSQKFSRIDKTDFFSLYNIPARSQFEYYNRLSRVATNPPLFFGRRKIYTLENSIVMDILNPSPDQIAEFKKVIQTTREFQFGGQEFEGNGVCQYKYGDIYKHEEPIPTTEEFIVEFMSDLIPRKRMNTLELIQLLQSQIPGSIPKDYHLEAKSLVEFEQKKYYIKKGMEFQVVPQSFMIHLRTNYPEFNAALAKVGLQGVGQLRSAGLGKFRLRDPTVSPLQYHGTYDPPVVNFSEEQKQFLKAVLLHDLIPKVGGIELLNEYCENHRNLSGLLLKLHYDWHDLRESITITLQEFLQRVRIKHGNEVATLYYKLALADQLAASMTRMKRVPTYSRYLAGHNMANKINLLELTESFLPLDSPFKLWKAVIKSHELAMLNESLKYGDQPLSTHLLLSLNFGTHLINNKVARIMVRIIPKSEKKFIERFWYKIFNITQKKDVIIYLIEEKIPIYSKALVNKIVLKSIRPETGWLRTG